MSNPFERDDDVLSSITAAMVAEAIVVVAIFAAAAVNLDAILEYFDRLTVF